MEKLTLEQQAEIIAESWINGQRKQAFEQINEIQKNNGDLGPLFNSIKELHGVSFAGDLAISFIRFNQ